MMSAGIANGVRCLACSTDSTMDGQVHELTPASSSRPGTGSNSSCERSSSSSTRRRSSGERKPSRAAAALTCVCEPPMPTKIGRGGGLRAAALSSRSCS